MDRREQGIVVGQHGARVERVVGSKAINVRERPASGSWRLNVELIDPIAVRGAGRHKVHSHVGGIAREILPSEGATTEFGAA